MYATSSSSSSFNSLIQVNNTMQIMQRVNSKLLNKSGNALFVHELCNDVLKLPLQSGDVPQKRCLGKERPLLVRFSSEEKKKSVLMSRVKELKTAPERYRKISIVHDLMLRQREIIKDGMNNQALQDVYRSVILTKLLHVSSAWWGFTKTDI